MINMPYDIELINSVGVPAKFHIRRADINDLERALALQDVIMDALEDKDLFATLTEEELIDELENDFAYAAIAEDGSMAGLSVLIGNTPEEMDKNYGKYLGYDEERLARTCSLELTIVDPKYRGYGLQRLFNKARIGKGISLGATDFLTTISPNNPHSYNNFLVMNFEEVDRRKLYGGKDRIIFRRIF